MNKPKNAVILVLVALVSFLAGRWFTAPQAGETTTAAGRKILYYHDPMHPSYKSDKPGIAPDCGMKLDPVYADGGPAQGASEDTAGMMPGTVKIGSDRQQLIGVKVGTVERKPVVQTIRILGRVAVD